MISIPVSVGELIDKLSILQIKKTKITNEEKLRYVTKEFNLLSLISSDYLNSTPIVKLYHELIDTNLKLWDIEDKLREIESLRNFDASFIELSRSVYHTNDHRFFLKNEINEISNSEIKEIKNYKEYKPIIEVKP